MRFNDQVKLAKNIVHAPTAKSVGSGISFSANWRRKAGMGAAAEDVSKSFFLPQSRTKYVTKSHKVFDYHIRTLVRLREILRVLCG